MTIYNDLVGLTVIFSKDKKVNIKERCSNRGHNCVSYIGNLIVNEAGIEINKGKCLVKEFAPQDFDTCNKVKSDNEFFVSRILTSQEKNFEEAYKSFRNNIEKTIAIINKINKSEDPTLKNYIVDFPPACDNSMLFDYDKKNNSYKGLMLYPYESADASKKISVMSIEEKLKSLAMLCRIINEFHENGIAIIDLKPENYIYYLDKINQPHIRLFDFDSVLEIDEDGFIKDLNCLPSGTPFFSAPEVLPEDETDEALVEWELLIKWRIGKLSDVYSLGAILLYYLFYDIFDQLVPDMKEFSANDLEDILCESTYEIVKSKYNISIGFWNRFCELICSSMNSDVFSRAPSALFLADEINTLLDIYRHKGVHPEVILDSAKKLSNSNDFKLSDFNKDLLCEVEEVND